MLIREFHEVRTAGNVILASVAQPLMIEKDAELKVRRILSSVAR
jgi:hypothetical protein